MKIAILNIYQNIVSRGAETFVSELAERLSKDYQVDVISKVNYLEILKNKYDLIIPTNGRWQAVIVRLVCWLTGAKMIISGQSGPGLDDRINLWTFPDIFVALSDFQKKWAKRANPFVRIEKIPNGVDINEFKPVGIRPGNVVLSVGAFTKEKRHDLTIKAVSKLSDVRLTIVGSGGNLNDEIEILGKSLLGDRFKVLTVKHAQIKKLYAKSTILAFPTVAWESFGIVLLEAMASSLGIVANDDPIRREIVGNAGIFVNPENIDEYAEVINKALKTNWTDLPRKQAEKFSWDIISKKYEELIEKIIN